MKHWIAVFALLSLPAFALAQTVDRITASPCYWLYSIPYVESGDEGSDPGDRQLAVNDIFLELRDLGVANVMAAEVGGNRAVTCIISKRLAQPQLGEIRDLLHSVAMGTRISESEARDIFSAPWYQIYSDPETPGFDFFDGRDGRELQTHPSTSKRLFDLYDAARQWRNRCGTAFPLPAGC